MLAPADVQAWLFDLDGVLTPTAEIHEDAWGDLFNTFLREYVGQDAEPFTAQSYLDHVDGKPHTVVLPPGERLEIEGLPEGTWRVKARWSTETLLDDVTLTLKGSEDLFVPLPQGAIDGQSKRLRDAMQ